MRRSPVDGDKTARIAKWERLEERSADRTGDGGRHTDAKGETEHTRDGDGRRSEQPACGRTYVGEHSDVGGFSV